MAKKKDITTKKSHKKNTDKITGSASNTKKKIRFYSGIALVVYVIIWYILDYIGYNTNMEKLLVLYLGILLMIRNKD